MPTNVMNNLPRSIIEKISNQTVNLSCYMTMKYLVS